jgi:uncharacterized protein
MPNRLLAESSPYLQQHAHNPVDWFPWGEEAFSLARATDKPILLSVGYAACHWCHVMAHESFENQSTAQVMNEHFVNVKVDREERPDVDQLYQGVVEVMGKRGGWPLTVFLTPTLKPFFGGTYFPPQARHGLPAFETLLQHIAHSWQTERDELLQQSVSVTEALSQVTQLNDNTTTSTDAPSRTDIVNAAQTIAAQVDPKHGGFGEGGPKFPQAMALSVLLRGFRRTGFQSLLDNVTTTLDAMAKGGLCDQLGGGFHRYAVDAGWAVPHFEKMLYDNALLLHLYSEAYQLTQRPLYMHTALATADFLLREMRGPQALFYSAFDADSEGVEGKFFVWTAAEIERHLSPAAAAIFCRHYNVTAEGNFEHAQNVLQQRLDTETLAFEFKLTSEQIQQSLASSRQILLGIRNLRVKPAVDDKALCGWNGLAIRALAFAGTVFRQPAFIEAATRCAQTLLQTFRQPDGRLFRVAQNGSARIPGMVEDYGHATLGLLALYQSTFDGQLLQAASELAQVAHATFWNAEARAFHTAPKANQDLLLSPHAFFDNPLPSGASTLTESYIILGALSGDSVWLDRAEEYLRRMKADLLQNPLAFGHLWQAADRLADGAAEITVFGDEGGALLRAVRARYAPTLALHHFSAPDRAAPFAAALVAGRSAAPWPAAYFCRHFACDRPVHSGEALSASLDAFDASSRVS